MALPAYFVNAVAVTPSDTTVYDPPLKGVYIGATGGNLTLRVGGANILFAGTVIGSFIWVQCDQVRATGTAATSIVGLR